MNYDSKSNFWLNPQTQFVVSYKLEDYCDKTDDLSG